MQFSITTEVDAPPEVVFAVLSEVERWPEWTPTVTRVERLGDASAPLALGGRLRIVQPKVPPAEWTVTALEPGRGFRLVSRSPGATVEANHWAEPTEGGHRSRVTLSVTFAGFLGRVIGWMMRGLNKRYLAQEAAGLKRRSEERARGTGSRLDSGVMAPEDEAIAAALDRFGCEVVAPARDAGIWWHDAMLAQAPRAIPRTAAPEVQASIGRLNRLAQLPPDVQEIVRQTLIEAVDTSIHALLLRLSDLGEADAKLVVDGVDILEAGRHELHGYPLTEEGWFARFSKYGEHGGPPVP